MLSKMNAINYEPNHFVNDWGFYIDPENVIQNVPNNEEEIRKKYAEIVEDIDIKLVSNIEDCEIIFL